MAITPAAGWQVDPNDSNRVVPIDAAAANNPNALNPSFTGGAPIVKTEPAVLSSVSGEQNFNTRIQPIIDSANRLLETSKKLKVERDTAAANKPPVEDIPFDVKMEMDEAKTPEEKLFEQRLSNYDKQQDTARETYSNLSLASHASATASINSLTNSWRDRRALLERQNKGVTESWRQQFIRSGQAEYSPGMSTNLLTNKEEEGAQKIKELDDEYNSKVAQINAATQSEDFARAAALTRELSGIEEKALTLMHSNAKDAAATNKEIRAKEMQATRDSAIADLVSQGVTDPIEIMAALTESAQASGHSFSDFTATEVSDTLKKLTVDGKDASKLPTDVQTFQWLRDNNKLPPGVTDLPEEQQYFAYLNIQKLAESGKLTRAAQLFGSGSGEDDDGTTPGKGAKNATEESIVRMRLFSKLSTILNKGTLSDADAARIEGSISKLRSAGLSETEILDKLGGFSTEITTPYNSSFRDLIVSNTETNEQQGQLMGKVSTLLNNGNFAGAMKSVENAAMANAKTLDPDNYLGNATADNYLRKIDQIREDLEKGGVVGYVSGNTQKVLGRLKSKDAAKLQAEITDLLVQMRHDISGTAVTPSESKFLDPLLADISDKESNFIQKLNVFENRILGQHNATRSSVGLPEVSVGQVLIPAQRLELYQSEQDSIAHDDATALAGAYRDHASEIDVLLRDNPNLTDGEILQVIGVR